MSSTTRQLIWLTIFIKKYVVNTIVSIYIFEVGASASLSGVVIRLYGSSKNIKVPRYVSNNITTT